MPRAKRIQIGPGRWLDVNLAQVAEKMGVGRSTLSRIFSEKESQQRIQRMLFLERLAGNLGITLDELFYAISKGHK